MPITKERARVIQFGKQATFDSAVAATFKYPGALTFTEELDFYEPNYPQGVRAMTAGQLVDNRKGFTGEYASELTAEEIVLFLSSCVQGGIAGVGAGADKLFTFNAAPAADPALTYITGEFATNDWTTKYGRQVPNILLSKLAVHFGINAPCTLSASMFGGAVVSGATPTAALTNVAAREILKGNTTKVFIDTTGAGIGGTLVSGSVISADVEIVGGAAPDYTLEGRANLDYGKYTAGDFMATFKVTMEYNGSADAEFTAWRNKTKRFMRVQAQGSTLGSSNRKVALDGCIEYVAKPVISTQNGNDIVTLTGVTKYDPTWAKIFQALVTTSAAAVT